MIHKLTIDRWFSDTFRWLFRRDDQLLCHNIIAFDNEWQ